MWDVKSNAKPIAELRCNHDNYIRNLKITSKGKWIVVAGETQVISLWDLETVSFFLN